MPRWWGYLLLLSCCFGFCSSVMANNEEDELVTISQTASSSENQVDSHAILESRHEATLSTELSAKILEIPIEPGQNFKKGQLLIRFDCDSQEADQAKALADLNTNEKAYKSAVKLYDLGIISKLERVQAEDNYKKSQADLRKINSVLKKCTIYAPYDGDVVHIYVHENEISNPSRPLMSIVDNKNLTIKLFVPSNWLKWIKVGTPFEVKFDETDKSYAAEVTEIGDQIDPASQTVALYGKLSQADSQLIAGMSGVASFKDKNPHG
ncbi:MAG TPA: efflux RND transporter periplasmic adaptor subunit [Coxiellaceae bacterium]|nr:efflux RND transporter periplasmic adaptor subunit [Coxiellaceae bacterium]